MQVLPRARRFVGPDYVRMKRVVDIVIVLLLLPVLVPLLLLIVVAIKIYSPGPIFYRQQRIGKDGRPFTMLKFRSMHVGNSSTSHREFMQRMIRENLRPQDVGLKVMKLQGDPRITKPGKLLRMLSLDELPQFINVLRGEMSIVGPRPPLPYEYELYNDWHKKRLAVLPGITGLWQITAHNQVSFDEMVQIDLEYIETMSLWLDLKIIVLTPLEMLSGKGGG
ncbi:MAG TPA: sugar transferase [Roseiflexaceae bacterium]|nr:sugar transferase [Roseiflexaceae bacterium]